ncbi:hypothetical protein L7F22_044455 [Adiantum nelumboides]|nr:hypothetical protein [Adiantum nelumboides]
MSDMYSRNVVMLSWNVRGLCSLARQMYVKKLIHNDKLDIVMLQETKTSNLPLQVKGYACITSKVARGSGGCMTLIRNDYKYKEVLTSECGSWIACLVCIQNEWVGLINVYAPNCHQERKQIWAQLSQIEWDVPFLFAGDWNCEDAELQSEECTDWKKKFDVVDAGSLQGCEALLQPTWTNRHMQSGFVARRLDRFYLFDQGSWISCEVQGDLMYNHTVSDHTPVRLKLKCKVSRTVSKGPPPFKFNVSFLREDKFCRDMKEAWVTAKEGILHPVARWQAGMHAITKLAKAKGKAQAKTLRATQYGLEHALHCSRMAATQNPNDPIMLHLLQLLKCTARTLETKKVEAARVQSNMYWLKTGDAPNKTFFRALRAKKDNELITALRKPDGAITEDEREIKELFRNSLSEIVGKPMYWNEELNQKLNLFLEPMDRRIPEEKSHLLGRPFSLMKYAGQDLCDLLNLWRREGTIQPEFNKGLIKLIPKGQDKLEVKSFRPLTMLNTVYKVMAKALTLRIRTVVGQVVHSKQFGFVQGRSIHEAILNVITAIDWAAEQEDEYVMINMDLEKAYDRVSWEYILAVVERMGFGELFTGMVKTLFQNASATIQVNGYITESFQLARSIRQGCPLAPLLFAIATDPLLRNLDL